LLHNRILKDSSFEQNRDKIDDMMSADTEERIQVVSRVQPSTSSHQYNPYHLSTVNNGHEENNRYPRQFDTTTAVAKNTDYYFYLRRIYSFWYEYLPSIYRNYQDRTGRASTEQDKFQENGEVLGILWVFESFLILWKLQTTSIMKTSKHNSSFPFSATPKYKHAFFSMLTLVCLLLAILGVCVYILKKNNKSISSATSIL
jgi:hypothetical protein